MQWLHLTGMPFAPAAGTKRKGKILVLNHQTASVSFALFFGQVAQLSTLSYRLKTEKR